MLFAAAAAAALLYLPSLRFPIIYDSLLHIRIAKSLDLVSVWLPTDKFGFYRPLTFLPLILIRRLFGYYPSWLLHGLNIVQHGLNAALVVGLSWRLWGKHRWALTAGLLLALFPFAYQAVAVYGHNVHLSAVSLTLLGLHAYMNGLDSRKKRWWALTAALFTLGLLNHETGVLFGVLAALVQLGRNRLDAGRESTPEPRNLPSQFPWLTFLVAGGVYSALYQLLPVSKALPVEAAGSGAWLEILYLLQEAAYPFAWLAPLVPGLGAAPGVLAALGIALGLTAWASRNRSSRSALFLGWGWWGSVSFLLFISLPSGYLLHGPRLLYLGGVGLALLWPVLFEPLWRLRLGRVVWTVALGVILVAGSRCVALQLGRYEQLTAPIALVRDEMALEPVGEGILLINLPAWIAPASNMYPVGAEHVAALGHHLFPEELMTVNLQAQRPVRAVVLPELLRDSGFPYAVAGETDLSRPIPADWVTAGSQVFVVTYTDQGVLAQSTGEILPAAGLEPVAQLGSFPLYQAEALACDGAVVVTTGWGWSASELPAGTLSLFVQMLGQGDQLVAQADAPPLGFRFNLIAPVLGWQMVDRRVMTSGADDSTSILLGVYDFATGERLPAWDAEERQLPDNALRVAIRDCESGRQRPGKVPTALAR